jgi:hypothetical protein
MGGSSSSVVTNENNTLIVNESDIKVSNKNLNDFVSNTIIKNASECSAAIKQLQTVKFNNITTKGDFNIGEINQSQNAALTFDCLQASAVRNDIAANMAQQMMSNLENKSSADVLDKLEAAAKTETASGSLSFGGASSNSEANNINNYTSVTKTKKNIENVIKNSVANNFTSENVQKCISEVANSQNVEFQNLNIGGNMNIKAISQSQAADSMTRCIQQQDTGNKITSDALGKLGVAVKEEAATVKKTEAKATSESKTEQQGLADGLGSGLGKAYEGAGKGFATAAEGAGKGIEGAGKGLGNAAEGVGGGIGAAASGIGDMFSGMMTGPIIASVVIVCLIICLAIAFFAFGGMDIIKGVVPMAGGSDEGMWSTSESSSYHSMSRYVSKYK